MNNMNTHEIANQIKHDINSIDIIVMGRIRRINMKSHRIGRREMKYCKERFRINAIQDIYTKLGLCFSSIIGYSDKSRKLYYHMYNHNNGLLTDVQEQEEKQKNTMDIEYHEELIKLHTTINELQYNMKYWFDNGQKCMFRVSKKHKIPNEIIKEIMSFV